jgi:glycosyltransferase involved in cell wall biosynthesis
MRLRQAVRQAVRELRAIRDASKVSGGRDALIARARHDLGLEEVDTRRVAALESRLSALEASTSALQAASPRVEVLDARLKGTVETLRNLEAATQARLARIDGHNEQAALGDRIDAVTTWVRAAELTSASRLSVILATYNRCDLLRRAVDSVRAQEYPHWELVIVDDGSTDDTSALLTRLSSEDERIVVLAQPHRGVGAARNAGLAAATGDIICYLDDDNTMQSLWLKAVAWAFERQPGLQLLYGARVMDVDAGEDERQAALPFLHFEPFERRRLEAGNFIDLGVISHLRALPEAHFDESLEALGDWDLLLRLTVERPPLALPVVASIYTTSAPHRITRAGNQAVAGAAVYARMLRDHSLRVLSYNSLFPLVPETYIPDEMKALTDNGAVLAWCTERWSPSPVTVLEPTYTDLDVAVRAFQPDVLVVYWATFAETRLDALSRVGKPFALRVHSFDFDPEAIERVRSHPLCIGTWAYPHHARLIEGAHDLVPLVTSGAEFPEPAAERPIVLSACAGVPKKDWPVLVTAFAELARKDVDCRIVVGVTDRFEAEPSRVRQLIQESRAPVKLSVDVPHDQVIALLARTAAVVYTLEPGGSFGMPRSIVEGMYAGTSVILPARPEAPLVAGPNCRTYVHPEDIVRHATEILGGGPDLEAERQFNRRFAQAQFADPALATSFAAQLTEAVSQWRSG